MKIATLNVGTMNGRSREIVDIMQRKILCVQETRWEGQKAKELGEGYKMSYSGEDSERNSVGIIVSPEMKERVLHVIRNSTRSMIVKLEVERILTNVIFTYAPQVGCDDEEKEEFRNYLEHIIAGIPNEELLWIVADSNRHVGAGNEDASKEMGKHSVGEGNKNGTELKASHILAEEMVPSRLCPV